MSRLQWKKFRPDFLRVAVQDGHGAAQAEPRFARRAGIEIKHASDGLAKCPVRVAENDGIRLRARDALPDALALCNKICAASPNHGKPYYTGRAKRVRIDDVMDEEFPRAKLEDFRFLERQVHVGVAINGGDGPSPRRSAAAR